MLEKHLAQIQTIIFFHWDEAHHRPQIVLFMRTLSAAEDAVKEKYEDCFTPKKCDE